VHILLSTTHFARCALSEVLVKSCKITTRLSEEILSVVCDCLEHHINTISFPTLSTLKTLGFQRPAKAGLLSNTETSVQFQPTARSPNSLCDCLELVTSIFADAKISRPRLGIIALSAKATQTQIYLRLSIPDEYA
jgi:hypothetical protein